MRWELLYGKDLKWIESLPEGTPAKDKPELWPENQLAATAFKDLVGQRDQGMSGSGEIPVTQITEWAEVYQIDDVPDLLQRVRTLDRTLLQWAKEQRERKRAGSQPTE